MLRFRRVDRAVPSGQIGVGERVAVLTRKGHAVAEGLVASTAPVGLVVRAADGVKFFSEDVYLFLPQGERTRRPKVHRTLVGSLREARAEETPSVDNALSSEDLPDDIQQAVAPQAQFSDDGMQKVMSAVGDAALDALKRAGVDATDLYGLVDAIQAAVSDVVQQYADLTNGAGDEGDAGDEEATADEGGEEGDDEDHEGAVDDASAALDALGGQ